MYCVLSQYVAAFYLYERCVCLGLIQRGLSHNHQFRLTTSLAQQWRIQRCWMKRWYQPRWLASEQLTAQTIFRKRRLNQYTFNIPQLMILEVLRHPVAVIVTIVMRLDPLAGWKPLARQLELQLRKKSEQPRECHRLAGHYSDVFPWHTSCTHNELPRPALCRIDLAKLNHPTTVMILRTCENPYSHRWTVLSCGP
jgi:hypothetical protein